MATFLLIGAYAHDCLGVERLPEKDSEFVLTNDFADSTGYYMMPVLLSSRSHRHGCCRRRDRLGGRDLGTDSSPAGMSSWVLAVPLAYLAFDLAEDGLLMLVLGKWIGAATVSGILPLLTKAKIVTFVGAWVVAIGTGALANRRVLYALLAKMA